MPLTARRLSTTSPTSPTAAISSHDAAPERKRRSDDGVGGGSRSACRRGGPLAVGSLPFAALHWEHQELLFVVTLEFG